MVSGRSIRLRFWLLGCLLLGCGWAAWAVDLPGQWRAVHASRLLDQLRGRESLEVLRYQPGQRPTEGKEAELVIRALLQLNRAHEVQQVMGVSHDSPHTSVSRLLCLAARAQVGDRSASEQLLAGQEESVAFPEVYEALVRCAEYHADWHRLGVLLDLLERQPALQTIVAYHRGRSAELQEDFHEAVEHYRQAVQRHTHFARARFRMAKCLMELQRFEEAAKVLETLLGGPYRSIASIESAVCWWELGQPRRGLELVEATLTEPLGEVVLRYMELDEFCDRDRAALVAARCWDAMNDPQRVVDLCRRVLASNHRSFEARSLLIKNLQHQGRIEEAQEIAAVHQQMLENRQRCAELRNEIEADPGNPQLRLELARRYWETESEAEGRLALQELLARHPDFQPALELHRQWQTANTKLRD
ncbi:MAG: hypothetical protein KatS3mg111_3646 [Pirellulaceae bacterium]|nr:MAG: hypothetical protein KatS3mg111_3646 [Pirellulaceae bacterium]